MIPLFFGVLILPLAYLTVLAVLLFRKNVAGVGESVACFILVVATTVWAIVQSRSSTAGLGFLSLPFIGSLGGFLGLAFGRWRRSDRPLRRLLSWAALAAVVLVLFMGLRNGAETRTKNSARGVAQAAHASDIERDEQIIDSVVKANPARQRAWIDSSIRARMSDRAFLIAAVHNDSVSPEVLDTVARSTDWGLVEQALRNPNTSTETLTRVFHQPNSSFFYQVLAGHSHTPPEILRAIYADRASLNNLEYWLVENPATPRDVLDDMATKAKEAAIVAKMLHHPLLDCGLLNKLSLALNIIYRDSVQADFIRPDLEQMRPSLCGKAGIPSARAR